MTSISLDHDSFLGWVDQILSDDGLCERWLDSCRKDEANFRTSWYWLISRENSCPHAERALFRMLHEPGIGISHVHAFHGCRIFSDSTYHSHGIQPLSREWIEREIVKWSGSLPAVQTEANQLLQQYLKCYEGTVCSIKSLQLRQKHRGYVHTKGSETLRNFLKLHAPDALNRYLLEGQPSILEFLIPVSDLNASDWRNYLCSLLCIWLASKVDFDRPSYDPWEGGFVLNAPVPPTRILCSHECDEDGVLTGEVMKYHPAPSILTRISDIYFSHQQLYQGAVGRN
jgi:hypothetical protein